MSAVQEWLRGFRTEELLSWLLMAAAALLCIMLHEISHGLAAYWLGDPTAKRAGRLSFNPLRHIDLVGLVMMVIARFGWAKPVPIDPRYFKHPKRGMALTALAGPVSNFLMAWLSMLVYFLLFPLFYRSGSAVLMWIIAFFRYCAVLNVSLCLFNLFPIPPLDGSKVLLSLLPDKAYWTVMRYERYGFLIIAVLLLTGVLDAPLSVLNGGLTTFLQNITAPIAELIYS